MFPRQDRDTGADSILRALKRDNAVGCRIGRVELESEVLFTVQTPLGFSVRVTKSRWALIVREKHPAMMGEEQAVRAALKTPDEVRQSRTDSTVYLFYGVQQTKRWVCAVTKRSNDDGFLVTAYPTDAIKEGTKVWPN